MIKLYLFDIEGTTTDISFVHKVLFPYSAQKMEEFVLSHQEHPVIKGAIAQISQEEERELSVQEVIGRLLQWIKEDRKHPSLKEIQGLIWDAGYVNNHFQGHVYPDTVPFFRKIISTGAKVGIYSSGSVHAQKLIFGYSEAGDLTPLISYYFDTKVGAKREKASYERIAREAGLRPQDIHFFSDIPQELEAAEAAGLMVCHVVRAGTAVSSFKGIQSFEEMLEKV